MPDTRNVQSPYPRGQGFASVPVLFSLPNVQPLIAAASTGGAASTTVRPGPDAPVALAEPVKAVSVGQAGLPEPAAAPGATHSAGALHSGVPTPAATGPIGPRSGSRLTSQITNATIGILVVAVGFLAYRNYYSGHSTDPSGSQQAHDTLSLIPTPSGDAQGTHAPVAAKTVSFPTDQPSGLNVPQPFPGESRAMPVYPAAPAFSAPAFSGQKPEPHTLNTSGFTSSMPNSNAASAETPVPPSPDAGVPSEIPSQKPAIPMLLQPSADNAEKEALPKSASDEREAPTRSPYGSNSMTPASLVSVSTDNAAAKPSPMPPAKLTSASTPAGPMSSTPSTSSGPIDTETPTLNTRDIIRMRSGQRRDPSGAASDPNAPRIESMPRTIDGSRAPDARGSGASLMSGQAYPPIAPMYEPISMNTDSAAAARNRYQAIGTAAGTAAAIAAPGNQRITQPSTAVPGSAGTTAEGSKPATTSLPYQPLSPALPNPNDTIQFDDTTP